MKDADIEKLLEEWKEREKNRIELKKDKKIKKKELSAKAEEAPVEEAKAEEAPAEEAKEIEDQDKSSD